MVHSRKLVVAVGLLFLSIVLGGCSGSGDGEGQEGSKVQIGMMPKLMGISYFDAAGRGAEEAAAELGVELVYDGPTQARSEDQVRLVNGWVAQGFDVIAIAPNDPDSIASTLKNAREDGTVTLTWDTDANADESGRSIFVNQATSESIAFSLVDVMAKGVEARGEGLAGDYLIVSGTATASNQNTWMKFMRQRIAEKYPAMNLLEPLYPSEDQQKAQEQTSEALAANPELKGIWAITSVALPAAAKATRDAGRSDSIFVTGLSLPNQMREYVLDGTVEEFVLWSPVDLGYLTIHVAHRLSEGKLDPGTYDFGRLKDVQVTESEVLLGAPVIFNRDNIGEFEF